jgi:hypothetical protein
VVNNIDVKPENHYQRLSLQEYMKNVTQLAFTQKLGEKNLPPLKIVISSLKCNLDSVCSTIALAYYLTFKFGHINDIWLPVINCAKDDFYSNFEVKLHIIDNMRLDQLFFISDLTSLYCAEQVN